MTNMSGYNVFKLMNAILEMCVVENMITKNEKENATFTACYRTVDEMKEPFVNSKNLTDMGLHLCQVKQETVPCFFKAEWKERLDKGGCAIVSTLGESKTNMSGYNVFKLMNAILEMCVVENMITKNEKENATFTACYRTVDEMKEPFVNSKILTDMGLHLCQVKQETVPCFFKAEWKERLDKGVDDRDKFSRDFTSTVRTTSFSSIYRALSNDRADQEKNMICERFFKKYKTVLRNSYPPDLVCDYILQVAYVKKE